jgi:hypothetical protein
MSPDKMPAGNVLHLHERDGVIVDVSSRYGILYRKVAKAERCALFSGIGII